MKILKKQLRKLIAEKKREYTNHELKELSSGLFNKLEESSCFINAHNILLYYSLPDEVYTHDFIDKWCKEKNILLPVVVGDNLELRQYTSPKDLRIGAYHILEPVGEKWNKLNEIDLCIIPGVAFDHECRRLGRGKGYYDRLLPLLNSYKIGICFEFQLISTIPEEPFDIRMDAVWTEKGEIRE